MTQSEARRLVILAEGRFSIHGAKTAVGVLRFSPDTTVAVLDSEHAGQTVAAALDMPEVGPTIPVVATVEETLAYHPTHLLIGIAPPGGVLPDAWRGTIIAAMRAGLHVISGLHTFLNDDEELAEVARASGVTIWDVRQPDPAYAQRIGMGQPHRAGSTTVYFAGSDCNVGKMTAALVLEKAARERGWQSVFAATGQTGIMIAGIGIPADRVISDFLPGAAEWLVQDLTERFDWVFVEGQGSLVHPSYSPVTLGLIHGSAPDVMILCHELGRTGIDSVPPYPIPSLTDLIRIYESAAGWLKPARVVGISLNTFGHDDATAQAGIAAAQQETGLPTTDPVRYGADVLLDALQNR